MAWVACTGNRKEVFMSREEAAAVYLDNLLGFHGGYIRFQEAERTLSAKEKQELQRAVSGTQRIVVSRPDK